MLHADFAMIDDHEIVHILGSDNRVKVSEISPFIQQWAIENNGRFRPGYYVLRILEAFVAGGHASLWYANRLLLALVSALALYAGLRVILRPIPTAVVTLLFFSGPQNEIWTRLGPAETYGVPLVLTGFAWIAVHLGRHKWQPTRLFPGLTILLLAGFVKESFIPVLPAVLVFIYIVMPLMVSSVIPGRPRFRFLDVLILLLLVTGVGMQVWLTVRMLNASGLHDFHLAESPLRLFPYAIKLMLERYSRDTLWFVPVIAGLAGFLLRNSQVRKEPSWRADVMKATALLAAGGFLILVPQGLVYGNSAFAGRYFTPGNLFSVFAAALGLYLCSKNAVERGHIKLQSIVAGMLIAVTVFKLFGTYREANAAALSTHKFQTKLAEIIALKTQHPDLPLLFYSVNVYDREPLISVASFLAARLPNPEKPFLNPFDWKARADSVTTRALAKLISEESLEGDEFFAKISDFDGGSQCIAVIFSGFNENVRCPHLIRLSEL